MVDSPIPPQSLPEAIRIEYVPRPGLAGLTVVNFLLGLITLSIYRFWAKTNVRKHIWSCVHINGEPLEYTGRGGELFKGALVVFLVFGLPAALSLAATSIVLGPEHPALAGLQVLIFLAVAVLWGAALYRARRYQLSRTLWRGIRGTLRGSSMSYSLMYFGSMLARAMTFGWSTPAMNCNLQQMIIGDMQFGNVPFKFKGRAGPLYPSYAVCWVLALVLLAVFVVAVGVVIGAAFGDDLARMLAEIAAGEQKPGDGQSAKILVLVVAAVGFYILLGALYPVIWSFYTARELALFASYTSFDQAKFRFEATAASLIGLAIGNMLIWILTLGIARPYMQQRLVRYLCDRIKVDGIVNVDAIQQSMAPLDTMGEGLADAFDVGGI